MVFTGVYHLMVTFKRILMTMSGLILKAFTSITKMKMIYIRLFNNSNRSSVMLIY